MRLSKHAGTLVAVLVTGAGICAGQPDFPDGVSWGMAYFSVGIHMLSSEKGKIRPKGLKKAIAEEADHKADVLTGWGDLEFDSDDKTQSMELYRRALATDPEFLPALWRIALHSPDRDEQMRTLEALAAADTENGLPLLFAAYCLSQAGRWGGAMKALTAGVRRSRFMLSNPRRPSSFDITFGEFPPDMREHFRSEKVPQGFLDWVADTAASHVELSLLSAMRQLARNVRDHSIELEKQGKVEDAYRVACIGHQFGMRLLVREPRSMIGLSSGIACLRIADTRLTEIEERFRREDVQFRKERSSWHALHAMLRDDQLPLQEQLDKITSPEFLKAERLRLLAGDNQFARDAVKVNSLLVRAKIIDENPEREPSAAGD